MLRLTNLFLKLFFGKHGQFIAKYFLRIEYFLVVHFFDERVVLDAIGLKKLHVSHLESLPDRLGNELGLEIIQSVEMFDKSNQKRRSKVYL